MARAKMKIAFDISQIATRKTIIKLKKRYIGCFVYDLQSTPENVVLLTPIT